MLIAIVYAGQITQRCHISHVYTLHCLNYVKNMLILMQSLVKFFALTLEIEPKPKKLSF